MNSGYYGVSFSDSTYLEHHGIKEQWKEAKSAYIETGKNHIDRVFNNIKYRD